MLETAPVLPTHGPLFQPTPVTILILSLFWSLASAALALLYAAAHGPEPPPVEPVPDGVAADEVLVGAWVVVLGFVEDELDAGRDVVVVLAVVVVGFVETVVLEALVVLVAPP